jgi:hypothetical protein
MRGSYIPEAISNVATLGPRVGCFALMAPQGRLTRGVVPATADHGSAFSLHRRGARLHATTAAPSRRAGDGQGWVVGTAPDTRRTGFDFGALRARRQCCAPNCHYKAGLSDASAAQKKAARSAARTRTVNHAVPLVAWVACEQPVVRLVPSMHGRRATWKELHRAAILLNPWRSH